VAKVCSIATIAACIYGPVNAETKIGALLALEGQVACDAGNQIQQIVNINNDTKSRGVADCLKRSGAFWYTFGGASSPRQANYGIERVWPRLASLALALFAGALRTHSGRVSYRCVDRRPNFFMWIADLAVSHLQRAQSVGICGGVIVQALLDGAGVNSNFARYLWKV
jgi:hypothetical protein